MGSDSHTIGLHARIRLTHGVLQRLADDCGADLLHVKGPAVHEDLLARQDEDGKSVVVPRVSTDADVLVRPAHLDRFLATLEANGWRRLANFREGSPFGHASNYWHDLLGHVDVHRRFPGIEMDAEQAFDRMWADRLDVDLAHTRCATPSVLAQRLVLLLHAARSGSTDHPDIVRLWTEADEQTRARTSDLAVEFDAEVGLAAATGRLEHYRDARTYDLWRQFSTGDTSRLHEWRARIRAAGTPWEAISVALQSLTLNRPHLEMDLGHPLTRADIVRGYLHRTQLAARELRSAITARIPRRAHTPPDNAGTEGHDPARRRDEEAR